MSTWQTRILHLGLGRFHRGHQAVYYQKMKDLGDPSWGVISMSMRSTEARDQMKKVHLRYPVLELSADNAVTTWIESIREAYSLHQNLSQVMEVFKKPELEIITLTITEKGYDLDSNGNLDLKKNQIIHDLQSPEKPESAIGLLAMGIRQRRLSQLSPLTIISCDNLRDNGKKLQRAVETYLEKLQWMDDLVWLKKNIKFPCTMVDRIVPSLLPGKILELEKSYSLSANSEVIATETFCQWVIEDHFSLKRPQWEKAGVEFVKDVRPYEEMKLKLLNAAHSYLAYAGLNRGLQFVHEAINDPQLRMNVIKIFEEVTPLLHIPESFDVKEYQNNLIIRFQNNKLPHQLRQIAMDGSQKLPQRIFSSINIAIDKKSGNKMLIEVIHEWLQYVQSLLKDNKTPDDPEAPTLKKFCQSGKWNSEIWDTNLFQTLQSSGLRDKIFPQD